MKKTIPTKLKVGDVLARDILSDKGMLILNKGTVLNENLIDKIKNIKFVPGEMDENFIFIEKDGGDNDAARSKEYIEHEVASLEKRFKRVNGDKLTDEIKEIIKDIITEHAEQL